MPLYNDLEVRPRHGSALPSYTSEGTRSLEPRDEIDMRALAIEAAKAGALGAPVGAAPLVGRRFAEGYSYEPPLSERLRFPHEGLGVQEDLYKMGMRFPQESYVQSWMEPTVKRSMPTDMGRWLAALPDKEFDAVFDDSRDTDISELSRRRQRPYEVDFITSESSQLHPPRIRATLKENPMMSYSIGGQSGIAPAQDVFDATNRATLRDVYSGADPSIADKTILDELAWDRARSGEFSSRSRAIRGLKSLLSPVNITKDLLLGSAVGAGSALTGYASEAPESAGLFTPPGSGYEGLVTAEDIEAAAEARELRNEAERQRLLEQYRASGYDLDPNTRLRDLR